MGKKLRNAPIYYTLVQAKFNPILSLDSYLPSIHEPLRKRFPDVQRGSLTTVNLASPPPDPGSQQVLQTTRFIFSNIDKTACFILDQGALTYHTTAYDGFQTFVADFMKGLEAVDQAVPIIYSERIGVRYLDAILPKEGGTLGNYLAPTLLGLSGALEGTLNHSFSETFVKNGDVNVIARSIIQGGEVGLPPDLLMSSLPLPERIQTFRGPHAILDIDGSVDTRKAFDLGVITEHLNRIHDEVEKAFHASVTKAALGEWE